MDRRFHHVRMSFSHNYKLSPMLFVKRNSCTGTLVCTIRVFSGCGGAGRRDTLFAIKPRACTISNGDKLTYCTSTRKVLHKIATWKSVTWSNLRVYNSSICLGSVRFDRSPGLTAFPFECMATRLPCESCVASFSHGTRDTPQRARIQARVRDRAGRPCVALTGGPLPPAH